MEITACSNINDIMYDAVTYYASHPICSTHLWLVHQVVVARSSRHHCEIESDDENTGSVVVIKVPMV
jgi:hypothetical protein